MRPLLRAAALAALVLLMSAPLAAQDNKLQPIPGCRLSSFGTSKARPDSTRVTFWCAGQLDRLVPITLGLKPSLDAEPTPEPGEGEGEGEAEPTPEPGEGEGEPEGEPEGEGGEGGEGGGDGGDGGGVTPPPNPGGGGLGTGEQFESPNLKAAGWTQDLPYKKHRWSATGGTQGSGALEMFWTVDTITKISGSSMVRYQTPNRAIVTHYTVEWDFRLTNWLDNRGSNVKFYRSQSVTNGHNYGLLLAGMGRLSFQFEQATDVNGVPDVSGGLCAFLRAPRYQYGYTCPHINAQNLADNQWHHIKIEVDWSNPKRPEARFWIDGVGVTMPSTKADVSNCSFGRGANINTPGCGINHGHGYVWPTIRWENTIPGVSTMYQDLTGPKNGKKPGPNQFSPAAEMFSGCCGNSGSLFVDNFTLTVFK